MNLQIKMIKSFILISLWISILIIFCSFNYSFNSNAKSNNPVNITYDNLGRVTKVEYSDGSIANYKYDKNGNIKSFTIEKSQDDSDESTDNNKNDDNDKKDEQSGDNDKSDGNDINNNHKENDQSGKESQGDNVSSSNVTQNDDGNTEIGKDNSGNNNNLDGTGSDDTIIPSTPVYAVDELEIINAFKRSMPVIKSVKRTAQKEKYFMTVKISKIKKNNVLKKISFQIKYSPNKNFKKSKVITVNQNEKKKLTSKKFMVAKTKYYYIKARSFTKTKTGKKIYSKYSKVHKIRIAK